MTQEAYEHIHSHGGSRGADGEFVIGYHIGPFGRYARLIFAVYFLVFFAVKPLVLDSQPLDDFLPFALETLGWVAVIAAVYFVTFYFLGELLLSKMNPWMGTVVFLGLPTVLGMAVFTWFSKFSSSPPGARSSVPAPSSQHLARARALL